MPYGEGNGLHRRRQSLARSRGTTLRPPSYAGYAMASWLDRRDHSRLPDLVADRTSPSLFHTREQTHELLEPPGSLAEQDGTDAVEDGADEGPHRASWLRRLRLRP